MLRDVFSNTDEDKEVNVYYIIPEVESDMSKIDISNISPVYAESMSLKQNLNLWKNRMMISSSRSDKKSYDKMIKRIKNNIHILEVDINKYWQCFGMYARYIAVRSSLRSEFVDKAYVHITKPRPYPNAFIELDRGETKVIEMVDSILQDYS